MIPNGYIYMRIARQNSVNPEIASLPLSPEETTHKYRIFPSHDRN